MFEIVKMGLSLVVMLAIAVLIIGNLWKVTKGFLRR